MIELGMEDAPHWLGITGIVLLWASVLLTIQSGVDYIIVAAQVMGESEPAGE